MPFFLLRTNACSREAESSDIPSVCQFGVRHKEDWKVEKNGLREKVWRFQEMRLFAFLKGARWEGWHHSHLYDKHHGLEYADLALPKPPTALKLADVNIIPRLLWREIKFKKEKGQIPIFTGVLCRTVSWRGPWAWSLLWLPDWFIFTPLTLDVLNKHDITWSLIMSDLSGWNMFHSVSAWLPVS